MFLLNPQLVTARTCARLRASWALWSRDTRGTGPRRLVASGEIRRLGIPHFQAWFFFQNRIRFSGMNSSCLRNEFKLVVLSQTVGGHIAPKAGVAYMDHQLVQVIPARALNMDRRFRSKFISRLILVNLVFETWGGSATRTRLTHFRVCG